MFYPALGRVICSILWMDEEQSPATANPAAGRSSMDPATADKVEKKKRG